MSPTNANSTSSSNFFSTTNLAKFKKILLKATIILLSFSALLAILAVLAAANEFTFKILATTSLLGLFSLISTNNILRLSSKRKAVKIPAATALITGITWLCLWLCILWGLIRYDQGWDLFYEVIWRLIYTCLAISIVSTIISSFTNFNSKDSLVRFLSYLTIICAVILCGIYLFGLWTENYLLSEIWRFYLILFILVIFGTITTPILVKVKQGSAQKPSSPTQAELRAQIEREVRAQIAAEQAAQAKTTAPSFQSKSSELSEQDVIKTD